SQRLFIHLGQQVVQRHDLILLLDHSLSYFQILGVSLLKGAMELKDPSTYLRHNGGLKNHSQFSGHLGQDQELVDLLSRPNKLSGIADYGIHALLQNQRSIPIVVKALIQTEVPSPGLIINTLKLDGPALKVVKSVTGRVCVPGIVLVARTSDIAIDHVVQGQLIDENIHSIKIQLHGRVSLITLGKFVLRNKAYFKKK